MSLATLTTLAPSRRRWLSLLTYLIVLVGLIGVAIDMVSSLLNSYAALDKNRAILDRLDRQTKRTTQRQSEPDAANNGPPFLVGKTITIAGAALQERVESAVKKAGGNVLSSQIDLQGPRSAEGFVGLTESIEIGQAALQPLLYDLEAGMPYLFVEILRYRLRRPLARRKALRCVSSCRCPGNGKSRSEAPYRHIGRGLASDRGQRPRRRPPISSGLSCRHRDRNRRSRRERGRAR